MPVGGADFAMLRALAAEQRRMAAQENPNGSLRH